MPTWHKGGAPKPAIVPAKKGGVIEALRRKLTRAPLRAALEEQLSTIAFREGVPSELARKVVSLESAWNPNATSTRGYKGLFQLGSAAVTDVYEQESRSGLDFVGLGRFKDLADYYDPAQNMVCGVRYLRVAARYIGRSVRKGSDWPAIYMAFNIGHSGARAVLAGRPDRAAALISEQAYGSTESYWTNLQQAFESA